MSASMLLTGLNGALGLYSGVKGIFDSAKEASRQKKLQKMAKAEEEGWYKRNYYGNLLENSATRAAIKRVESSLRRLNEQNRAFSAINGATPENAIARNEQGLRSMENVFTNLASREDDRKMHVDAIHRQNKQALLSNDLNNSFNSEKVAANLAGSGLNLLQNALLGVEWGKEKHDDK
ncbi:MAG: hypothetical protein IKJ97_02025 [Bacteroidaceae bacterium]|nr:hypothetical protein [Bacteroidaceae bacterium]